MGRGVRQPRALRDQGVGAARSAMAGCCGDRRWFTAIGNVCSPICRSAPARSTSGCTLENLWTVLDGLKADNPARDVPEAVEPEPISRGLPYDVVEAIVAQMPDQRYQPKVTADIIACAAAA